MSLKPPADSSRALPPLVLGFALLVPYLTVPVGLYALRSAWVAILLYHAGMLAVLALARPAGAWRALTRGWQPAWVAGAFLLSAALGPAFLALESVLGLDGDRLWPALAAFGLTGAAWPAFILYYGSVHPVLEEVYWREFVVRGASRPLIVDVAFAAYHGLVLICFVPWIGAVAAVVGLLVVAIAWRRIAVRQGGLGVPLASHVAADLSLMLALAASLSRSRA